MSFRSLLPLIKQAPVITGAIFWLAIAGLITSCEKRGDTPDWQEPGGNPPTSKEIPAPDAAEKPQTWRSPTPSSKTPTSTAGLHFIAYNVENWLTMDRFVDQQLLKNSPKPDSEKKAVVQLLAKNAPDVLGICEVGEREDLAEIQASLRAAGLNLPHSYYTGGADPVRHLALLSRFPIVSTAKPVEMEYSLRGRTFGFNRGILDATIQANGKNYRFLGIHLKSKRDVENGNQEEMRIHEARLLRRHVDSIFASNPQSRLIVYGDFNDTRPSKAFKSVTGSYNSSAYLTAIPFKDSRGHAWTHHWSGQDIYSRIDFVAVSRVLRPEVDFKKSHIIDADGWDQASDHRPLMAIFK